MKDVNVVDFETKKIDARPHYPPKPVGAAIRWAGGAKEYLAWGHPTGNNCDIGTARAKLKEAYCKPVVFHHAAFDMDVAECHLNLPPPKEFHDTLFLSFLDNPYAQELALKDLAADLLDMPPEEQEDLRDWIQSHIKGAKRGKNTWGEFIGEAPGNIVDPYAVGDVDRTYKLFRHLLPDIKARGMMPAYERELAVVPITLEMERSGVRVDQPRLRKCRKAFVQLEHDVMRRIAKKLRIETKSLMRDPKDGGFNINSAKQLGDALMRAGKLDKPERTPSGQISTKMALLKKSCNDKELMDLLAVHSVSKKYLSSFIEPWLEKAAISGGRLMPKFNQVRGYDEGGGGARSGRFSSSDPNMQNITANVEESGNKETLLLVQQWVKDDYHFPFIGLRDFILPDEDSVMICVDYNQQELRILAHFEQGVLMRAFIENPDLDIHEFCRGLVKDAIGIDFPRKHIKVTVFGIVYGMGVGKLADRLEIEPKVAKQVRDGILKAVPGIKKLMREMETLSNRNEPLITWGGRQYYCEEPKFNKKTERWMSFEYKMLNYKIQPSAADCTKQGMINVQERVPRARIAIQVHDELVCMAPSVKYGPRIVEAMCDVDFRVPMRAEAKYSDYSWARAAKAA